VQKVLSALVGQADVGKVLAFRGNFRSSRPTRSTSLARAGGRPHDGAGKMSCDLWLAEFMAKGAIREARTGRKTGENRQC
jgi:hypothetical protein